MQRTKGVSQVCSATVGQGVDLNAITPSAESPITLADRDFLSDCRNEPVRTKLYGEKFQPLTARQNLVNSPSLLKQYYETTATIQSASVDQEAMFKTTDVVGTLETRPNLAFHLHTSGQGHEGSQLNKQVLQTKEKTPQTDEYGFIASRKSLAANLHALCERDETAALTFNKLRILQNVKPQDDSQAATVTTFHTNTHIQTPAARHRDEEPRRRASCPKRKQEPRGEDQILGATPTSSTAERLSSGLGPASAHVEATSGKNSTRYSNTFSHTALSQDTGGWDVNLPSGPSNDQIPNQSLNAPILPRTPNGNSSETPLAQTHYSRIAVAKLKEQLEALVRNSSVCNLPNLYDSHDGGVYDTVAVQGITVWFREFNSRTQSLLAQARKPLGRRVKIAILDTGIDLTHPDFSKLDEDHPEYGIYKDRVKGCQSFVSSKTEDGDSSGHGTHSAALLLKLAPKANVYVARVVETGSAYAYPEVVAKAIMHATDEWKVDIIMMSFGWHRYHPCVEQAIDHASSRQVIICAAASNNGANRTVAFPANYPPVICVHSANGWGRISHFTAPPLSIGPNFAVVGEAVSSTWPGEEYGKRRWGTSTATPIMAAIVALVLEFINQKPVKTSHDGRLKTALGMKQVLLAMSLPEQSYSLVMPWKLLDARVGRARVESRILDCLEELFGPEGPEQDHLSDAMESEKAQPQAIGT
ncbi:hypothetical protein MMC30_006582 [Trapelia coarctata]|nr:hypothetical protein [Trapelia coarctata]